MDNKNNLTNLPLTSDLTYQSRPTQTSKLMNNLDRNLSNASTTGAIAQENTNARVDELEDKVLDLQERHEILLLRIYFWSEIMNKRGSRDDFFLLFDDF